jgi:hypothetical protein
MEAALLITVRADKRRRSNGEDEEASGEKSCETGEEVAGKTGEEAGQKAERSQIESGSEEKHGRCAGSVKTFRRQEGRPR